jgi:hypothetical protein
MYSVYTSEGSHHKVSVGNTRRLPSRPQESGVYFRSDALIFVSNAKNPNNGVLFGFLYCLNSYVPDSSCL